MSSNRKPTQIDLTTNKLAAALEQATTTPDVKPEIKDGTASKNVVKISENIESKKTVKQKPKKKAKKVAEKKTTTKKVEKPAPKQVKVALKKMIKKAPKTVTKKAAPKKPVAKKAPTPLAKTTPTMPLTAMFEVQSNIARQAIEQGFAQIEVAQKLYSNSVTSFFKAIASK